MIHNGSTASGSYIGFATDAWSPSVNDISLLSLTVHWIDSQFKRTLAVFNAQCLTEAHMGEYIAVQILTMLEKWDVTLERVYLVITENASNMAKAMCDASTTFWMFCPFFVTRNL